MAAAIRDDTIHTCFDPPELACSCGGLLKRQPDVRDCWECPRCQTRYTQEFIDYKKRNHWRSSHRLWDEEAKVECLDEKLDQAIYYVIAKACQFADPSDVLSLTQAVLNLAHAKELIAEVKFRRDSVRTTAS